MDLPTRPVLKPALRRLWRDDASLQLGIEPRHAVVLSGLDAADVGLLDLLDGTRDHDSLIASAARAGLTPERMRALLRLLAQSGALDDAVDEPAAHDARLEPDLLSLSLAHRAAGAARAAMARRRAASVAVHGAGRVGATVATLLAASGVGRLHCVDREPVRPGDLAPGGVTSAVAGRRGGAAAAVVRRTTNVTATDTAPEQPVDVAVVAPTSAMPSPEVLASVRARPHLLVLVRETVAVVGPFVDPGRTPCVRCVELTRADRDRAWPSLAAQLVGTARRVDACDVTLATLAASLATMQVLAWLDSDGAASPASVAGVLEFDLVAGRLRRRSLHPHSACGCMPAAIPGTMTG